MDLLSVLAIALAVFLFASPFLIWNLSRRLKQAEKKVDELSARIDWLAHKTKVTDEPLVTEARKATPPEEAGTKSTRPPPVDSIEHLAFEPQKEHRGASPILIKDKTTPPTPHPAKGVPEKQKKATGGAEWGTHKGWRALNLVGFVFTFAIGGMWGYRFYEPALFASTEPFLILFFLLYLAIPILFAQRQPPELKGYVDGTLIFGVGLLTLLIGYLSPIPPRSQASV